jgi:hypothetical protein
MINGRAHEVLLGRQLRLAEVLFAERISAGHLHVAADRQDREAVVGALEAEAQDAGSHAHAEDGHTDLEHLGHQEVPELVDDDQDTDGHDGADNRENPRHAPSPLNTYA